MADWAQRAAGGCTVEVRVTPRSSRAGVEIRDGAPLVRVHAPPEGGRATEEARRLLAKALGVARSAVVLRTGGRSRRKVFSVAGVAAGEARRRLADAAGPR